MKKCRSKDLVLSLEKEYEGEEGGRQKLALACLRHDPQKMPSAIPLSRVGFYSRILGGVAES